MAKDNTQAAVGEDKLEKALNKLNELAKSSADEKADLLQKAMNGELSEQENARLLTLFGGGQGQQDTLAKSATAGLAGDPAIQQAVDVSEYLRAVHAGNMGAIEVLADSMEKSFSTQSEFNIVLAKAVTQIGGIMKSLRDEVHGWAEGTSEQPKGAQNATQAKKAQAINKSFSGQAAAQSAGQGDGDTIQKGEVLAILEEMHLDSLKKGMGGCSKSGEDLNKSIAKYEQTGKMTRQLVEEVKAFRAGARAA